MKENKPYVNEEDKLMLTITNRLNNGVKRLLKKEKEVKNYLSHVKELAYERNSEDYYVIENVFGNIIEDYSQEIDLKRIFKTIYLRPLLAVASRNEESYKYFDFEHNCKDININKLLEIAKDEIMNGNILYHTQKYNSIYLDYKKLADYLEVNVSSDETEDKLSVCINRLDELYSNIMSLCNTKEIVKRNPLHNNLKETFQLETRKY